MKNLVRSYFWCLNLDKNIEQFVNKCTLCVEARPDSPLTKLSGQRAWVFLTGYILIS